MDATIASVAAQMYRVVQHLEGFFSRIDENHWLLPSPICSESSHCYLRTVVPALGDPRRERPPAVCGHFVNVPTHFKVNLPVISGHLSNADADSHLLVVSTCYNGQCKQMPRFRWSFQPKIAGTHPNLRPTDLSNFRAVVWWLWQCVYSLGISLVVIAVCSIARCIIFAVPRLPVRPCDERPPAMYGHFCLVPGVSVHDRYYCTSIQATIAIQIAQVFTVCQQKTRERGIPFYWRNLILFVCISRAAAPFLPATDADLQRFYKEYFVDSDSEDDGILFKRRMFVRGQFIW